MSEWKEYRVSDLCELIGGGTPKTTIPEYWGGNIPWLSVTDFNTGRKYCFDADKKITEKGLKESSTKILKKGQLIISARGTVGVISMLGRDMAFNQSNYGIDAVRELTSNDYLYYLLKNNVPQFISNSYGAVFDTITKETFEQIKVSLPRLPEQKSIAETLSSLDDKIDLLHRQNKTLEQLAETLFRQWFLNEAGEGWKEVSLSEFISVKHGYAFKGNCIETEPTNLILVTPGNFKIGGGFKFNKFKYYKNEDFPVDYIFQTGDLAVTMTDLSVQGDTLGYAALIPENYSDVKYLHNQRVGKVEFKKEISKSFIYQLMKTRDYQWFILGGASGTSIRHTSPTSICEYTFALPPKQRLLEYDCIAIELEEKIKTNQNQIRTLTQLRDTLLPKLMSGEVRIL